LNDFEAIFASFDARILAFLELLSRAIRVFDAPTQVEIQNAKTRAPPKTRARKKSALYFPGCLAVWLFGCQ
jgi:hypothetical protein